MPLVNETGERKKHLPQQVVFVRQRCERLPASSGTLPPSAPSHSQLRKSSWELLEPDHTRSSLCWIGIWGWYPGGVENIYQHPSLRTINSISHKIIGLHIIYIILSHCTFNQYDVIIKHGANLQCQHCSCRLASQQPCTPLHSQPGLGVGLQFYTWPGWHVWGPTHYKEQKHTLVFKNIHLVVVPRTQLSDNH